MVSVSGLDGVWLGLEVLLFGVCGVDVGCLIVVRLGVLGCWFGSFPCWVFFGFGVVLGGFCCFSVGWCNTGFLVFVRVLGFTWVVPTIVGLGGFLVGLCACFKVVLAGWWLPQAVWLCCLVFGF